MMNTEIQDGTKTCNAYQQIIDSDDADIWPGLRYIDQMDETALFLSKLYTRMSECGYQGDQNDIDAAVQFLRKCCTEAEAPISRQTLTNWLTTGKVAHNTLARQNIYKLCFALKMNAHQAEVFFLKAYLARPFNYKSLYETVCFFCLNHHDRYRYSDVGRIMETIEKQPLKASSEESMHTVMMRNNLLSCNTEEDLIEYWLQESVYFGQIRYTAKSEVDTLLNRCYEVVPENHRRKIKTPAALLEEIFNYRARGVAGGEPQYSSSIAKSSFPNFIKLNFPDPQKIWKILCDLENNTNKATDDMLRKTIIVLKFYEFFAGQERKKTNPRKYGHPSNMPFEEFTAQMNQCLERCGYLRIYWRNPFDWMFGYCAHQKKPLEALKEIIQICYLDEEQEE